MRKVTVVGAGRVGEATAQLLARKELCRELVLLDVNEGAAAGAALDILESAPLYGFDVRVSGGATPALMAGSDLVVITAGFPRSPGMSRFDVLEANLPVIDGIVDNVLVHAPEALLMVVTNPVDLLTYRAWRRSGWDRRRVFGQAGMLDTSRMASFIAAETGFSVKDISAMVLGGHGDAMVPLVRYTCVNGVPVEQFIDADAIARIIARTRNAGGEILALRRSASAHQAPAIAVAAMVDALACDRRRLLPAVCVLDGEYGAREMAMGVPAVLGCNGIEEVVELALDDDETRMLAESMAELRANLERLSAHEWEQQRKSVSG